MFYSRWSNLFKFLSILKLISPQYLRLLCLVQRSQRRSQRSWLIPQPMHRKRPSQRYLQSTTDVLDLKRDRIAFTHISSAINGSAHSHWFNRQVQGNTNFVRRDWRARPSATGIASPSQRYVDTDGETTLPCGNLQNTQSPV